MSAVPCPATSTATSTAIGTAADFPVLELPLDRPRSAASTSAAAPPGPGGHAQRVLDPRLIAAMRLASAKANGSLFAGLLGAFVATLYRLSGQDDIVVGIPAAGQPANVLLPLRIATHAGLRFAALLRECHMAVREALPCRQAPPNVSFHLDLGTGDKQHVDAPGPQNVELALTLRACHDSLLAEARYNTDLFDEASVQRWLDMFACVLRSATHDPAQPIGRLDVLSPEAAHALVALQPPRTELGGAHSALFAHATFVAFAARQPARPAVRDSARDCSYGELDALSNRLAHALRERGVGRGQRVGLCLERGLDMLVALLAVLKSGAAYVPLDPNFPQARLDYYAQDAQLSLLLTASGIDAAPRAWRADAADRVLELDVQAGWRHAPTDALLPGPLDARPDDAAYVIYTSGSTGKPKGVCVPHRAVANLLQSMQQAPGIGPDDRIAAVTTLSFDMAVPEVLLPLAAGAQIVLVQRETAMDGQLLRAMLAQERITILQATPGMWQLLLEAQWQGRQAPTDGGPGLRGWIGAEPVRAHLALDLLARCTELWNLYGPTETTVWSTAWRMQREVVASRGVSIGQPIANTDVWILDAHLQPCPIGVPGEICIGGLGMTLGYLDRPELTAERFVSVRILGTTTQVYRTGDRGRWRNDGLLEHLGRLDFQVKVRGYRIEPGEIEARCNEYAGVSRSVVVAREDHPGDVRLVAYLAPKPGVALDRRALMQHLRERLPTYMVPQHVVLLATLPTLPNGKLDRGALPPPQGVARDVLTSVAPVASVASLPSVPFVPFVPRAPLPCHLDRLTAPLTPSQARICRMEEQHPGRAFHNMPSAQRLLGALDAERLQEVLRHVVRRQPALRTCIGTDAQSGEPLQSIAAHVKFALPVIDLRSLPADQREAELVDRMQELADRPIDIRRAPMAHAALFRLDAQEHVFVFVPHQLVWDDASFGLLQRELRALHSADGQTAAHALPAVATTHGDHAEWLAAWMREPAFEEQLGFWHHRATGNAPPLPATDMPRRADRSGQSGTQPIRIDLATTQRLRDVALGLGAGLDMLMFGIFALSLGQAFGAGAVAVAHPVPGRDRPETAAVMGRFDALLPVTLKVDLRQSLPQFMHGVKEELRALAHHVHAPFERFVAPCHWRFSFRDARDIAGNLGGIAMRQMPLMQRGATEDIALRLVETPHGLEGALVYNAGIYLRDTGAQLRERYLELLHRATDRPEATLAYIASAEGSTSAASLQRLSATDASAEAVAQDAPATATDTDNTTSHLPLPLPEQVQLAQVWADVIRIDVKDIRASDNFFELGGDSLLAQRAVRQTERLLGYRVAPQRYLFENLGQIAASSRTADAQGALPDSGAPASEGPGAARAPGLLGRAFGGWLRKG